MESKSKKNGSGVGAGIGIALVSAVAAAAGTYFLYGTKDGKEQRKNIKGWALKAKGEVLEKIEKLKDVNEDVYNQIVSDVMKKYEKIKKENTEDISKVANELHGYWKHIQKNLKAVKSPAKKKSK